MLQWLILNCNQTLQLNFLAYYNNLVSLVRDLTFGSISPRQTKFVAEIVPILMMGITKPCTHHHPAHFKEKIQSCSFCLKIDTHGISRMLIPNPDIDFWNSNPKTHFWASFGRKSQSCSFFLRIGTHGILIMLIFIPTLVF